MFKGFTEMEQEKGDTRLGRFPKQVTCSYKTPEKSAFPALSKIWKTIQNRVSIANGRKDSTLDVGVIEGQLLWFTLHDVCTNRFQSKALRNQLQKTLPITKPTPVVFAPILLKTVNTSWQFKTLYGGSLHLSYLTFFILIHFQRVIIVFVYKFLKTQPYLTALPRLFIRLHDKIEHCANSDQYAKNDSNSGVFTNRQHQGSSTTTKQINDSKAARNLIKKSFLKMQVTDGVTCFSLCFFNRKLIMSNLAACWFVHKEKTLFKAEIFPFVRIIIIIRQWNFRRDRDRGFKGMPSGGLPSRYVGYDRFFHCISLLPNVNESVAILTLVPVLYPRSNFRAGGEE